MRGVEGRERDKRKDKIENIKGCEVSASLLSTCSTLAAAQIYRLFILHQVSALNERKHYHIQVNDKKKKRKKNIQ